jgi:fucose 4-O-acetylase-like acetyltransferase
LSLDGGILKEKLSGLARSLGIPKVTEAPGRSMNMDALKGLAILLVVYGHAISWTQPDSALPVYNLRNFTVALVYAFHMPLFSLLSGFLIFGRKISARDKFMRLVVPYLAWLVIGLPVDRYVDHVPDTIQRTWQGVLHGQAGLWYLWFLFLCYLCLIPLGLMERKRKYMEEVGLVLFYLFFLLVPLNIAGFMHMRNFFIFFAVGYTVAKHRGAFSRMKPIVLNVALAGAALLFLIGFLMSYKTLNHFYIFNSIREVIAQPGQFIQHYVLAFLGIFGSYGVIRLLRRGLMFLRGDQAYRMLCWFGLVTMDIYVAHALMMRLSFGEFWVRIISAFALGIILSLALSFLLLRRSRVLGATFLGMKWPSRAEVDMRQVSLEM